MISLDDSLNYLAVIFSNDAEIVLKERTRSLWRGNSVFNDMLSVRDEAICQSEAHLFEKVCK